MQNLVHSLQTVFDNIKQLVANDVKLEYPIGYKERTGRQIAVENWYTPSGRRRKVAKKEYDWETIPVTETRQKELTQKALDRMEYFFCKVNPDDSLRCFMSNRLISNEDIVAKIISSLPEIYQDHVIGFGLTTYKSFMPVEHEIFKNVTVILEDEYQKKFHAELHEYMVKKADWYSRFDDYATIR